MATFEAQPANFKTRRELVQETVSSGLRRSEKPRFKHETCTGKRRPRSLGRESHATARNSRTDRVGIPATRREPARRRTSEMISPPSGRGEKSTALRAEIAARLRI